MPEPPTSSRSGDEDAANAATGDGASEWANLADRLRQWSQEHPEAARSLRPIALALAALLPGPLAAVTSESATEKKLVKRTQPLSIGGTIVDIEFLEEVQRDAPVRDVSGAPHVPNRPPAPAVEAFEHRAAAAEPPVAWRQGEIDLALLEARCRLKAEACLWSIERCSLERRGEEFQRAIKPRDETLVKRARDAEGCLLWMMDPFRQKSIASADFAVLAGVFEALALAVSIARQWSPGAAQPSPNLLREFLPLMAEAQSALRHAVRSIADHDAVDEEQEMAFRWVRRMADTHRVFIERYMRLDDPAEFRAPEDLKERLEACRGQIRDRVQRQRGRRDLLGRMRYHARQLSGSPEPLSSDHANDHQRITESLEEWLACGFPLSASDLHEALQPLSVSVRSLIAEGSDAAVRAFDAMREVGGSTDGDARNDGDGDDASEGTLGAHVQRVRSVLEGRRAVVFGGEARQPQLGKIEEAFGLRELLWVPMTDVSSEAPLHHALRGDDVAIAFVLIKLSSHYVTEQVPRICDDRGIPVVRLRAGYHPNRIAHDVLEQVSEKLGIRDPG